jgi:hypothetical protein
LGERKSDDQFSAYSVFNKGFHRILGTIDVEQFEKELLNQPDKHFDDDQYESGFDSSEEEISLEDTLNKTSIIHSLHKSKRTIKQKYQKIDLYSQLHHKNL